MSTLTSADAFSLRRTESSRARPIQQPAAGQTLSAPADAPVLERLAAWAERQPLHRHFGSHMLVGLRSR